MPDYDAILFDFDGVLADSEPLHYACWKEILAPMGVPMDWDFFAAHCIGMADGEMIGMMAARANPPCDPQELLERYPQKKELFRARMAANPPFAPGVKALLEALHARYRLAVVTSSGRAEIEPALAAAGLRGFFQELVCGREAGAIKPAPEPYLMAAKLLGAQRPLVVEDSEPGTASARAAGFEVVVIRSPEGLAGALSAALGVSLAPPSAISPTAAC